MTVDQLKRIPGLIHGNLFNNESDYWTGRQTADCHYWWGGTHLVFNYSNYLYQPVTNVKGWLT